MKTLTATPITAKVDPKYWVFNGAPDGATAQNDTTRLSCTAIRTADTKIYQVHVDNVAKLFTALTVLSTNTPLAPFTYAPTATWVAKVGNYTYTGDNFIPVNDTSGFAANQVAVILEGDSQSTSPAFYSEWATVGSIGQIPISLDIINADYGKIVSSTSFSTTSGKAIPTPYNVGNEYNQGLIITCSGVTPEYTVAKFFPDWTTDYVYAVSTTPTALSITTVTPYSASSNAYFGLWSMGQVVYNSVGDYVGIVNTITSTTISGKTYTKLQMYPTSVSTAIVANNWADLSATITATSSVGSNILSVVATTAEALTPGVLMAGNPISFSGVASGNSLLYYQSAGPINGAIAISTVATVATTATLTISGQIFGSTISPNLSFGVVSTVSTTSTVSATITPVSLTVATTGQTTTPTYGYDAYYLSAAKNGYGAEILGSVISTTASNFVVPTNIAQSLMWDGVSTTTTHMVASNDVIVLINTDANPSGVITTPGGNQYKLRLGPTPPYYTTYDPSPLGLASTSAGSLFVDDSNGPYASTGTNASWFAPYYQNLVFTGEITNYASTPVATFVSMQSAATVTPSSYPFSGYAQRVANIGIHNKVNYYWEIDGISSSDIAILNTMFIGGGYLYLSVATTATNAEITYVDTLNKKVTIGNWGSVTGTGTWTASVIASDVVTCDSNAIVSALFNQSTSPVYLTFRNEGVTAKQPASPNLWKVVQIPSGSTNTFTIGQSNDTSYANQVNTYTNGDSQNYIYNWEVENSPTLGDGTTNPYYLAWNIPAGSSLSTSTYDGTGQGYVGLQNGTVGGVHLSGTTVGSYQLGRRWIGSNTNADLESLTVDQIGSRYTTSLYAEVKGGVSTSFIASPAPSAVAISLSLASAASSSTLTAPAASGGYYTSLSGVVAGMAVTGTVIPSGTIVVAVTQSTNTTAGTVTISNKATSSATAPFTFTSNVMNLTADISNDTSVVIVGVGKTQEAVLLSGGHQGLDGSTNNVPIVWDLVNGTQFRFDHSAGEPIFTPNILCYNNPLKNDHGVDTPVIGSPDSGTASPTSSAALIAQNT